MVRLSWWLKGIWRCLLAGSQLIIVIFVVSSCATSGLKNIGSFKENPSITKGFQSHELLPGYTYYFSGFMDKPEAIVGIHRDYRIEEISNWGSYSTRWKELEPTTENLKKLADGIGKNNRLDRKPYGVVLSDPAGKQVGILYVMINRNYQPRIRVFDDNRVNVVASVYVGPPISAR